MRAHLSLTDDDSSDEYATGSAFLSLSRWCAHMRGGASLPLPSSTLCTQEKGMAPPLPSMVTHTWLAHPFLSDARMPLGCGVGEEVGHGLTNRRKVEDDCFCV
jgi:hypothetical protein